jgi:hypothetical protein
MATRHQRLAEFASTGDPPSDQPFELLCEDHIGTYVLPFLCRWNAGAWQSIDAGEPIQAAVVGWRQRAVASATN